VVHGPKTFWDTIATERWADRFEPFTKKEQSTLRLFTGLARDLGEEEFHQEPLRLSVKASPEESYARLEHAGRTQLRSMTMVFRQLWSPSEPAEFGKVLAILRERVKASAEGAEALKLLDILEESYEQASDAEMMRHVWEHDPMGKPKEVFTAKQVIRDWLYSGPFHTDKARAERVKSWSKVQYEYSLIKAVIGLAGPMWELSLVVQGALDEPPAAAIAA